VGLTAFGEDEVVSMDGETAAAKKPEGEPTGVPAG
jgi:hypothetical protein